MTMKPIRDMDDVIIAIGRALDCLQNDVQTLSQRITALRNETQKAFDDRYNRTKEAVDVLANQDQQLHKRLGEIERLPIINLLKEGAKNDEDDDEE